jgi:hypothetical protein
MSMMVSMAIDYINAYIRKRRRIYVDEDKNETKNYLISMIGVSDVVESSTYVLTRQK